MSILQCSAQGDRPGGARKIREENISEIKANMEIEIFGFGELHDF